MKYPDPTHTDKYGLPTAFSDHGWPFYPTPCCNAAATGGDLGIYCKECYAEVNPALGGFPAEPFTPIAAVVA